MSNSGLAGWESATAKQLCRQTEVSSPIYQPIPTKIHTRTHERLRPIPLTMNSRGACPNAAKPGLDRSSGRNSCHSVMVDSGDVFRPKPLRLKAPAALSHPQRPAVTRYRPGTLFPPSAQRGHASFRTNTVEGESVFSSQG